jgi:hypothetical protein
MLRHAFLPERSRTSNIRHCTCSSRATRSTHAPRRARALPGKRDREMVPVLSVSPYKQQTSATPGWECRRSTQRTPISWLCLTASSLLTSGEGEGSEPPGTRVARLKAPSFVLKPQREGRGNSVYRKAIPAFLDSLCVEREV